MPLAQVRIFLIAVIASSAGPTTRTLGAENYISDGD
jgi:hypothetical protein